MRHRRKGRVLGRSPSHRRALLRNLASALFLTERDAEFDENAPKVKGRITTTIHKAKEVQPLVEKCITIARKSLKATKAASDFGTTEERNSSAWKTWRQSDNWQKWNQAMAPAVAARRRALQLLGDKQAVKLLFDEVAPRMETRDGGYTRVLRLSAVRLGDAGEQAILEFVGANDRKTVKSQKPAFEDEQETVEDEPAEEKAEDTADEATEEKAEDATAEESAEGEAGEEASADGETAEDAPEAKDEAAE